MISSVQRDTNLAVEFLGMDEDIDAIYSHNDGMTLGAIEALEEKGLLPGTDVVIVTIDAQQTAIDALRAGKVNCVIECNPKTGPEIIKLAERLAAGENIPRLQYVHEEVFYEKPMTFHSLSLVGINMKNQRSVIR